MEGVPPSAPPTNAHGVGLFATSPRLRASGCVLSAAIPHAEYPVSYQLLAIRYPFQLYIVNC